MLGHGSKSIAAVLILLASGAEAMNKNDLIAVPPIRLPPAEPPTYAAREEKPAPKKDVKRAPLPSPSGSPLPRPAAKDTAKETK